MRSIQEIASSNCFFYVAKNWLAGLLFLVSITTVFSQNNFDKLEGREDIATIIVNKKMFEMMSKVKVDVSDKEMQQYHTLIKKLDQLKVFSTKSASTEVEMKVAAERYVNMANLEPLMQVTENGKNIKIHIKSVTDDIKFKELLLFVDGAKGEDSVLMSVIGEFDLNEIALLTDKMRLPVGKDLISAIQRKNN